MADTAENNVTLDHLRKELSQMREELAHMLENAGESARTKAKETAEKAEHMAGEASRVAGRGCGALKETVREQPVTACAVAAGVGLLVGLLLHRR
ncbi:glycine zipper domain-containing protein [Xanthobacter sp. TB0139]|uniref:glycine zipper domain-containing protein n=1 Tax=Xanthobacter sp. TB0139 TaxID=3459178 RepID=UPI00403A3E5C